MIKVSLKYVIFFVKLVVRHGFSAKVVYFFFKLRNIRNNSKTMTLLNSK